MLGSFASQSLPAFLNFKLFNLEPSRFFDTFRSLKHTLLAYTLSVYYTVQADLFENAKEQATRMLASCRMRFFKEAN